MSSQLVDIDSDGNHDILVGSYSGIPYLIKGGEGGFGEPEQMMDSAGNPVLIANFWNEEESKWDETDRAESRGHCTSASAVDWDNDGDLDLVLGDYRGGRLFLRLNEGTAKNPSFATTNTVIQAGGKPMVIEKGLAAPKIVDWDGDGAFDILCGGTKGGVYLFKNSGEIDAPEFAAAETLIEPLNDSSFIKKVPAYFGQPTQPGSSFHLEATDYDGDGDLDLLVGARCVWDKESIPVLSEEDQERLKEIEKEIAQLLVQLKELTKSAETNDERKEITQSEEYDNVIKQYRERNLEKRGFNLEPTESGDFVWLFRRK